jgi:hypothetical protein
VDGIPRLRPSHHSGGTAAQAEVNLAFTPPIVFTIASLARSVSEEPGQCHSLKNQADYNED